MGTNPGCYLRRVARTGAAFAVIAAALAFANGAVAAQATPGSSLPGPTVGAAAAPSAPAGTPQTGLNLPFVTHLPGVVKDDTTNGPATAVVVDKFGQGSFTVAPGGQVCDVACTSVSLDEHPRTNLVVSATPAAGWEIRGWTGCTPAADNASCSMTTGVGSKVHVSFGQAGITFAAPLHILTSASVTGMQVSGDTFTFPANSELDGISAGDFIATVQGTGFLKKVVSVAPAGSVVNIVTSAASLTDVISSGTLTLGTALVKGGGTQTAATQEQLGGGIAVDLPINLQPGAGSTLTGDLKANGNILAEVNIAGGHIAQTHIGISLDFDGSLAANTGTINVPQIPAGEVSGGCFPVLVIPVCVNISLAAGVNVTSDGPLSIAASGTFTVDGDVYYDSVSGFKVAGGVTPSWTVTPPAGRPTASVALGLEPQVDLSVLGVVGPSLSIPITMNATMAPNMVPWIRASATLEGDASIHGGALFLPDTNLGPFKLFSESGEFYRSPTAALQVFPNGAGVVQGSAVSGVEPVNCGLDGLRCAAVYNAPAAGFGADSVTLTAQPAPGWRFFSWGGACQSSVSPTCTVTMTQNQTVTVLFVPLAPPQP